MNKQEKNLVILLLKNKIKELKTKQKQAKAEGAILHYTAEYILIVAKKLLKKLTKKQNNV